MNVLPLDGNHIIVQSEQTELMKLFEQHWFTPVPVRYRHPRLLAGGFHCATLDIRRKGGCEEYF